MTRTRPWDERDNLRQAPVMTQFYGLGVQGRSKGPIKKYLILADISAKDQIKCIIYFNSIHLQTLTDTLINPPPPTLGSMVVKIFNYCKS